MPKLRRNMSVQEFDDNYFYLNDLTKFAASLGIPTGGQRKLELEAAIRMYLTTGRIDGAKSKRSARGARDLLGPDVIIMNYVDDGSTKQYLLGEVRKMNPALAAKSGQWYWINDWRREQKSKGKQITYGNLAQRLRELMSAKGRLPQIPSARYNNFVTDYLADGKNTGKSKKNAIDAWYVIKETPGPKTYAAYCALAGNTSGQPCSS
jgi:hypothetical protein